MDIMTVKEAAEKWGLTTRRVTEIIRSGRIKGVSKIGAAWVMPANTQKPPDKRLIKKKSAAKKKTGKLKNLGGTVSE